MIDLMCGDTADMLRTVLDGSADFVMLDPPWCYDNEGTRGNAADQYASLSEIVIKSHMHAAYTKAATDAYCAVWCTFPKLKDWLPGAGVFSTGWEYITGGAWGKVGGLGVGFHFRGDAELVLLYRKGAPKPRQTTSNLWLAPRIGHSEKPQKALRALIEMACAPNGLVLDLYAGASASCMRACRATGRRYLGAEIDPARHAEALRRFSLDEQASMFEGVA